MFNVNHKIILASNSPRRKELLAGLDVPFEVRVINGIDESYPASLPTRQIAEYISQKKAAAYRETMAADELVMLCFRLLCFRLLCFRLLCFRLLLFCFLLFVAFPLFFQGFLLRKLR